MKYEVHVTIALTVNATSPEQARYIALDYTFADLTIDDVEGVEVNEIDSDKHQ